jgi:hypothetical protein
LQRPLGREKVYFLEIEKVEKFFVVVDLPFAAAASCGCCWLKIHAKEDQELEFILLLLMPSKLFYLPISKLHAKMLSKGGISTL